MRKRALLRWRRSRPSYACENRLASSGGIWRRLPRHDQSGRRRGCGDLDRLLTRQRSRHGEIIGQRRGDPAGDQEPNRARPEHTSFAQGRKRRPRLQLVQPDRGLFMRIVCSHFIIAHAVGPDRIATTTSPRSMILGRSARARLRLFLKIPMLSADLR